MNAPGSAIGHRLRNFEGACLSFSIVLGLLLWLTAPALADRLALPADGSDVIGWEATIKAAPEDTLADIARRFRVGHQAIRLANPEVDFWLPGGGTPVVLPTRFILPDAPREGIVLNVPEMRLYYYVPAKNGAGGREVITHPVSIGRMDWSTPLGRTHVSAKVENPSWTPPQSIRAEAAAAGEPLPKYIPPGPDNPLGSHALRLALPAYLIHGTNRPYGIGMRVTHGCIRMYPEDIEQLFPVVGVGTPVEIVNQPVKVGWLGDTLFIEVHPPLEEDASAAANLHQSALEQIEAASSQRPVELIGRALLQALRERRGLPLAISRGTEK
ncbi:MAG: L,D-transpeptidase family protein [Xanthomonadales bacterium]|nr:L,D-transpeptidase family protein [Xanthomonadales bacterium]